MRNKWNLLSLIIMMIGPILGGCWNQKELTDLAFVMAMGIDKGETSRYDVTFQIIIPGNVASGQNSGGKGLPFAVYKSSGDNLTEAARKVTRKLPRRLYYAHTNLLVINEDVAREGVYNILDALERDPEFRTTTQMIVVKDTTADKFISTVTTIEKIPVTKITKSLKTTQEMLGENLEITIDEFVTSLVSSGKEPVISAFKIEGDEKSYDQLANTDTATPHTVLTADGLAIFQNGKLTEWINGEKARGIVWILNKVKSTDINLNWKGKKDAISITTIRAKATISANIKNGKPIIQVLIEEEGNFSEANANIDIMNPNEIKKIETALEKEIKEEITTSINEVQNLKSDIFGFGEKIHQKDPKLWKKLKEDWDEHFAELQVDVKVRAYIRRSGLRTNPFWFNLDQ